MAYIYALFGCQFCEGKPKLREEEQRIVSEAAGTTRFPQNQSFRVISKCLDDLAIARRGNHAHEASDAAIVRNLCKFGP